MINDTSMPLPNLPVALTTFVGREHERAEAKRALETTRLLTLTGPGGCGKTRLALQLATELWPQFPDGVWWCDLAAVTDPIYLPQSVASVLHLAESQEHSALEMITASLQAQRALLVLDNCEHLLSACAALAYAVTQGCPGIQILSTSLQPLGLPQETVWPVPPLTLPGASADVPPEQSDALRLFADRAQRALPAFKLSPQNLEAVITICRRLDGLPLAIELAAARVNLLTVDQIAARLDDRFRLLTRGSTSSLPRHQALRAAIDWSYQFLTEQEQTLLRRLSVFAGSFTLEMAEAICADGLVPPSVLDVLTDLVEKSLVTILERQEGSEPRFRLLETIRQYSREKLEEAGETAIIRTKHLDWFAEFAQQLEPMLAGAEARASLSRLDADLDNLRVALQWVRTSHAVEPGLRLAGSVWAFWQSRGYLAEGRNWLEELLSLQTGLPVAPLVRTKALYAAAALAFRQTDYKRAAELAEASLSAAREAREPARVGVPLSLLAILATEQGDYARATAMHQEALELYRGLGDMARESSTLINLGVIARRQADYRRSVALYEEALTIKRHSGDKQGTALALSNLGEIAIIQGKLPQATALLEESLLLYREIGNKSGTIAALNNLGVIARHQGNLARAQEQFDAAADLCEAMGDQMRLSLLWINRGDLARDAANWTRAQSLYADALAHLQAMGDQPSSALALYSLGLVAAGQGDDERALTLSRESLELYRLTVFPLGMVEALEAVGEILSRQGQAQRAARWLAAAEAKREAMDAPLPDLDRDRRERVLAGLQETLGKPAFATAWKEGRALNLEQAAAEASGSQESQGAAQATLALVPELRIFALGPARVLVADRALAATDWTYTKSKEMLFYLLARPSATKEQIGLDLWPDASRDQLRSFFHSALHHLRRVLGRPDWIRFEAGEYRFNREQPFEYDVQRFEDNLQSAQVEARSISQPVSRARAIAHLAAAADLWHGDFLADMDTGDWALYRREELHKSLLDTLMQLGELHFAEARYAEAAEAYRRALSSDNFLEFAHRGLMRCHARQGEAARAVQHYQDLSDLLKEELAAVPSPETTLLYERIRRGDDI